MPILTVGSGVSILNQEEIVTGGGGGGGSFGFVSTGTEFETPTTSSSWVIDAADAVPNGDLLVMILAHSLGTTTTVTPAGGWSELSGSPQQAGGGNTQYLRFYTKVASGEGSSYTWGFSQNTAGVAIVLHYQGQHASPVDASAFFQSTSAITGLVGSSISPTVTNTELIFVAATAGTRTFSGQSGSLTTLVSQDNNPSLYVGRETLSASGATGTRTVTASSGAHHMTLMVALKGA